MRPDGLRAAAMHLKEDCGSPEAGHTGGAELLTSAPRRPPCPVHSADGAGGLQK